jgi:hypothetical protein
MAHIKTKIQPAGQMPLDPGDRKPIFRVIGGDTWHVSFNLHNPLDREAASPGNTLVEVKLAETQFDAPLWSGEWFKGIYPDADRPGLCHMLVPMNITKSLRRGSYMFSVRVSDMLKTVFETEAEGSFLVEYKPTSDQHSIPYKDGTSKSAENLKDLLEQIVMEDGTIMIKDEDTGLYHKVVVVKDEAGDANLGVYKKGVKLQKPFR